jgi:Coenzyme PQQ synthesis protein D (PqqD)
VNGIHPLPKARRNQLVRKELGGEMLVYDRNSDEAHCLNATAARVWAHCDGRITVAEMAQLLEEEMKTSGRGRSSLVCVGAVEEISSLAGTVGNTGACGADVAARHGEATGNCGGRNRASGHFDHCAHRGCGRDLYSAANWRDMCERRPMLQ